MGDIVYTGASGLEKLKKGIEDYGRGLICNKYGIIELCSTPIGCIGELGSEVVMVIDPLFSEDMGVQGVVSNLHLEPNYS